MIRLAASALAALLIATPVFAADPPLPEIVLVMDGSASDLANGPITISGFTFATTPIGVPVSITGTLYQVGTGVSFPMVISYGLPRPEIFAQMRPPLAVESIGLIGSSAANIPNGTYQVVVVANYQGGKSASRSFTISKGRGWVQRIAAVGVGNGSVVISGGISGNLGDPPFDGVGGIVAVRVDRPDLGGVAIQGFAVVGHTYTGELMLPVGLYDITTVIQRTSDYSVDRQVTRVAIVDGVQP